MQTELQKVYDEWSIQCDYTVRMIVVGALEDILGRAPTEDEEAGMVLATVKFKTDNIFLPSVREQTIAIIDRSSATMDEMMKFSMTGEGNESIKPVARTLLFVENGYPCMRVENLLNTEEEVQELFIQIPAEIVGQFLKEKYGKHQPE